MESQTNKIEFGNIDTFRVLKDFSGQSTRNYSFKELRMQPSWILSRRALYFMGFSDRDIEKLCNSCIELYTEHKSGDFLMTIEGLAKLGVKKDGR